MFIASVMPSSYLILWCPLLLLPSIFSSIRDFSNESVCIRWPKYWSFSCSINPFNEYSGLISLKIVLIFLLSKELTGVFSSTTVQRHQLFGVLPFLQSSSHNQSWPPGRPQPWHTHAHIFSSLVAQTVKNLPSMWETQVQSLGWKEPLEKNMATHSSILAWRIPQRSLMGYNPWARKQSDTNEWLKLPLFFHIFIHIQ